MPTYVEIAVNVPQVSAVFDYHLPEEFQNQIVPGHLVEVPFGKQQVQGVILRFIEHPSIPETRSITTLLDPQPVLTPTLIALAQHLATTSLTPLASWIGLMIPAGLGQLSDTLYQIAQPGTLRSGGPKLSRTGRRLLELLTQRGALRGRQIDQAIPHADWRPIARSLVQRGILSAQAVLPSPRMQPKVIRTVSLACSPEQARLQLSTLSKPGSPAFERRGRIIEFLIQEGHETNVAWVYASSGGNPGDLRKLAEKGLVRLGESEARRDPLEGQVFSLTHPPQLTSDQLDCWNETRKLLQEAASGHPPQPILLHGVTGSGKTEIYLRAVAETLELGRQAIVLVPEIALTPQTIRRFASRFPGQVGIMHSALSPGERYDTWRRARAGELSIMVGPRSALFTPFANPGLIVVDECHDDSYYQNEPPFYHARRVAVSYARLINGVCLLGSATPDITDLYEAEQGRWIYLRLPARIMAHRQVVQSQTEKWRLATHYTPLEGEAMSIDLPPVSVVDMRLELKAGNRSIFSRQLHTSLENVLNDNQQAILFLNRRGSATYVFCRECGLVLKCPHCNLPLTYHQPQPGTLQVANQESGLFCHHCGYRRQMPSSCPQCNSPHIRQYGMGTERVEAEVQTLFPNARTLRWDFETTRRKNAHDLILTQFTNHQADILIGTQMLAKGLDLPLVTLVGVVLADVGLNLPDYRAAERTFQVLTQVAGRAGRSPLGGKVILQTFQPDHYVIEAAARHDYQGFYQREIEYRRQLGYPPFQNLVRLEYRHPDPEQAERTAQRMGEAIHHWLEKEDRRATRMIGPVPCFFSRIAGQYRWQIVLGGPDPVSLLRSRSLPDWRVEFNPPSLL
jgi:primosomal protein N' (replication factor Y)